MLPVVETIGKTIRAASNHEDEGHDEETDDGDDLERSKTKFSFTVDGYSENVKTDDQSQDQRDPSRHINAISARPKLNHH